MKKLIFLIVTILLLWCVRSHAATIYIRTDGGPGTRCTGLTDAADTGSGTDQPCALNHPNWAFPPRNENTTREASSSDTVVIASGSYRIGCQGDPNCLDENLNLGTNGTAFCHSAYTYDCYMDTLPSTVTIIGCSTSGCSTLAERPELWGSGMVKHIFKFEGRTGITIKDIVMRDRGTCGLGNQVHPCASSSASALTARDGIVWTGSDNITLTNVDIIGFAHYGIFGASSDTVIDGASKIEYNAVGGIDMDTCNNNGTCGLSNGESFTVGTESNNNPSKLVSISWNGCVEDYSTGTAATSGCYNGNNGGFGDGMGGSTTSGNWILKYAKMNNNTADGLDLKYASQAGATVDIRNSIFSGNAGNQLKFASDTVVYNTFIEGNCDFFKDKSYEGTWGAGLAHCNSLGDSINANFSEDSQSVKWYGNTMVDQSGNVAISIVPRGTCTNNVFDIKNSIFQSNGRFSGLGGGSPGFVFTDSGCTGTTVTQTHSNIDGFNEDPSGTGNVFTDPLLSGTITGVTQAVYLSASSPGRDIADESASDQPSTDYNQFARKVSEDAGALEFGSSYSGTPASCGDNTTEGSEVCDGTDLNSQTCVTLGFDSGTLACNAGCTAYDVSSCVTDPCGNGNIDLGEECDTANLNGQTCVSQGFSSGTLSCDGSCNFVTSSCVSITCPNGIVDAGETCDDNNSIEGDGCSSLCQDENSSYELFLNYVNTGLSVSTHSVSMNGTGKDVDNSIKYDFGVDNIGPNFVHRFTADISACTDNSQGTGQLAEVQDVSTQGDAVAETSLQVKLGLDGNNEVIPSGVGNLLVSCIAIDGSSGTITIPTGWTEINSLDSANISGSCAYKVSTSGESQAEWSWVNSLSANGWIGEYSGLATSSVLDVKSENGTGASASSISTGTTGTTSQNDELAIAVIFCGDYWRCNTPQSFSNSFAKQKFVFGSGDDPAMMVGTKTLTSTGTVETTYDYSSDASAPTASYAQVMTFKVGTLAEGGAGLWAATETNVDDLKQAEDAQDGISLKMDCLSSSAQYVWTLSEYEGTTSTDTFMDSIPVITRYIEIEQSGTTLTAKIYSDASYTTLLDTLTVTTTGEDYQYLYPSISYNDGSSGVTFSSTVSDLDITAGSPPPAPSNTHPITMGGCNLSTGGEI